MHERNPLSKAGIVAALSMAALLGLSGATSAQTATKKLPPAVSTLLSEAKAEGYTANIYGQSANPSQAAEFSKRISEFYGVPITLTMFGGLHAQKASELSQVTKAGAKSGIDIFWTSSSIAGVLERGSLVVPLDWAKAFDFDDSARLGKTGLHSHDGTQATVIYNTDLIKAEEAPKTYAEIVSNPKWKGRIAVPRAPNVFIYISYALGDEATRTLLKDLMAKQEAKILPTYPDVRNRVGSGEFAIGIGVDATELKRRGAPVEFAPIDPVVLAPWGFWLMKDAKSPATGQLFAYWIRTPEGQKALFDILGLSLASSADTDLAKLAVGKKAISVPHDFMIDILPERLPVYSGLMGIR